MRWLSLAALACAPAVAMAQAPACRLPDRIDVPRLERAPRGEMPNNVPITGYMLALSWSPQYCASRRQPGEARDAMQCSGDSSDFGWVLHGLWPQGSGNNHPSWCRPAKIVPQRVLSEHLCMSPSSQLLQHEWAKHGTCMSVTPAAYFKSAAILFRSLRFPDMTSISKGPQNAGSIRAAFARENRGINPAMIAVQADRSGWLKEVRFCLGPRMRPINCPSGQRGLADGRQVKVRPLR